MENIKKLFDEFEIIRNRGWIKGIKNGYSNVGITFETLLGKEIENFEIPDYCGIEIKTKYYYPKKYIPKITLFHATPDGKYLFETKRIVEKYGYSDKNNENNKIFKVSCFTKFKTKLKNGYAVQIEISKQEKKIYLNIYNDKNHLIDKETFWLFDTLKEKLYRKLQTLAYVHAKRKKINNIEHFSYRFIDFYKLKTFEEFLKLVEAGKIGISFNIGRYKSGNKINKIHDHGTAFFINENNLEDLYYKIPFTKYC